MNKLQALPHQRELISYNCPYTILNWERAQGATTGMFLKWICSRQSAIVNAGIRDSTFTQFVSWLKKCGLEYSMSGDRISGYRRITLTDTLQSVEFFSDNDFVKHFSYLRPNAGLIMIDNVDMFMDYKDVACIVERLKHKQQIIFSCDYNNLGWRHLEYNRGEVVHPETEELIARDYSWDKCLIDWKDKNLKRQYITKATADFYDKRVRIL